MKHIKTKKKKVVIQDFIVAEWKTCDKCEQKIESEKFNAFDFEFEITTGENFPEGGGGEKAKLDLCETCAELLVELLKSNGFAVQTEDWYW